MTGIGKSDQKTWDKLFFAIANVIFIAWLVVMPLDAVRFGWSHMPTVLQAVGSLLLGSFVLFFLTFRENSYLSPAVRVQTERGHTVVSSGPYQYLRHPMYAAVIPYALGVPGCLVLTGWGKHNIREKQADRIASFVANDILDAAQWVIMSDRLSR